MPNCMASGRFRPRPSRICSNLLGSGTVACDDRGRIARHQPEEQKDQQRHDQQHLDRAEQPLPRETGTSRHSFSKRLHCPRGPDRATKLSRTMRLAQSPRGERSPRSVRSTSGSSSIHRAISPSPIKPNTRRWIPLRVSPTPKTTFRRNRMPEGPPSRSRAPHDTASRPRRAHRSGDRRGSSRTRSRPGTRAPHGTLEDVFEGADLRHRDAETGALESSVSSCWSILCGALSCRSPTATATNA